MLLVIRLILILLQQLFLQVVVQTLPDGPSHVKAVVKNQLQIDDRPIHVHVDGVNCLGQASHSQCKGNQDVDSKDDGDAQLRQDVVQGGFFAWIQLPIRDHLEDYELDSQQEQEDVPSDDDQLQLSVHTLPRLLILIQSPSLVHADKELEVFAGAQYLLHIDPHVGLNQEAAQDAKNVPRYGGPKADFNFFYSHNQVKTPIQSENCVVYGNQNGKEHIVGLLYCLGGATQIEKQQD